MTAPSPPRSAAAYHLDVERQLPGIREVAPRLAALGELCAYYAYTNGQKARHYLRQLEQLHREHPHPEIQLQLLLNQATLEGLLYNHEVAARLYAEALPLVEARADGDRLAEACIDYAGTCMNLDRREQATELLGRADQLLSAYPNVRLHNRYLVRCGYLALAEDDTVKAVTYMHSAERRFARVDYELSIKDYYFQTLLHSGLGSLYYDDHNFQRSRNSYAQVVEICEGHNLRNRLSYHYMYLGNAYMALKDRERAEAFFQKSINEEDDSSAAARASSFANLGRLYIGLGWYDRALALFERSERVYKSTGSPDDYANRASINESRAEIAEHNGNEKVMISCLIRAYDDAERSKKDWLIINLQRKITDYYASIRDYRKAYDWQSRYIDNYQRLEERRRKESVREIQLKQEATQKKQEAERLRMRTNELQTKALRAQMNPHFIFNALNAIQYDIEHNNAEQAAQSLTKFADLMRSNLAYSELDRITIEDEITFLQRYLDINTTLRFEGKMSYRFSVDEELEEDILEIPTLILQPYIENSIEHGLRTRTDGHIDIRFELLEDDEDTVRVIIEDNGIGRAAAGEFNRHRRKEHRSMGTRITMDRLRLLHPNRPDGEVLKIIDRKEPKTGAACGTRIEVLLPLSVEVK